MNYENDFIPILLWILSPRHAQQEMIAAEFEKPDLTHSERMELIRMQGQVGDKDAVYIIVTLFLIAVIVAKTTKHDDRDANDG